MEICQSDDVATMFVQTDPPQRHCNPVDNPRRYTVLQLISNFLCCRCRQQNLLQQHIKTSHQVDTSAPKFCKLCQTSFNTVTTFHSHLVKSHSAYFASKTGKCATKDRPRLHRQALNGAHRQVMKKASDVIHNAATHDVNDNHGCSELHNGTIGNRVSNNNQEPLPDRTILHLDIDPSSAITTAPVKHQFICSPDSTTDAFGITKTEPSILRPLSEDNKDSMEEPKWYIGAPDGKMEEMKVSYKDLKGQSKSMEDMDSASQGSRDTDDIDIISSALDSPVCQLSPRELHVEPSSTTSPDVPSLGNSPERSLEESSIISIGSTPVASPACPRVGSSPANIDDTSQPSTIEACESEPASPTIREISPNAELLYGQCGDSDDDIVKRRANEQVKRHSISSDSDIDVETNLEVREEPLVSANHLVTRDFRARKDNFLSSSVSEQKLEFSSPERARGLNVSPEKNTVDTPVKVAEDVFSVDDQGKHCETIFIMY